MKQVPAATTAQPSPTPTPQLRLRLIRPLGFHPPDSGLVHSPDLVEPLGFLPGVVAAGKFHIAPVLGLVNPDVDLVANPAEVERILPLPLDIALDHRHFREETIINHGQYYKTWVIDHHEEYIWGATARIIVQWHAVLNGVTT